MLQYITSLNKHPDTLSEYEVSIFKVMLGQVKWGHLSLAINTMKITHNTMKNTCAYNYKLPV